MNAFAAHPRARWTVPAAALVVIAAGSLVASRTASADTGLPPRSAAQLLVDVQQASQQSLSGTVVQTANLGLPEIPGLSGQGTGAVATSAGGASLTSVLSGSHTWRVWSAGPTMARVALVSGSGESDVIRNGSDVWIWSSKDKSATHHTLTAKDAARTTPPLAPADLPKTPDEAAQKALSAIDPTTTVSTAGTAVVAGRSAYELVLTPKGASRVASVRIAVDADKHVPLRVQVYSTKLANPALEVGFSKVDFGAPDAAQFAFTPPPGTKVSESGALPSPPPGSAQKPSGVEPKVVGTGWSSVVVATLPAQATSTQQGQLQGILRSVPKVSGTWGSGRVIDGPLFSAVLADDGRVAVGAVAPDALYAALAAR